MKKSFILFFVLAFVFLLSIISIRIYEVKSFSSFNIINQYKNLQVKNHLIFLEEYLKSLKNLELLKKVEIEDKDYKIEAFIKKIKDKKYEARLIIKAINYNVRIHKKIELIK